MVLKECMTCETGLAELFREIRRFSAGACFSPGLRLRNFERDSGEAERESSGSDRSKNQ